MECITEAAARLAMSAAQHCVAKTASQEDDNEPNATQATAAANQGYEWHECQDIKEEESEWHECEQQHWGRAKSAAIASNPIKTTSQIRREQRHRALQTAIARRHKQEQAAMAQSDTAHSEDESDREMRGRQKQQSHHDRYNEVNKAELEQQLNTRVTAGVGRDRREARKKREKPVKEMQRMIQSNRQPDRKHRTTAACMLTRMIESTKLIRVAHQQHAQARARARRERNAILNKRDTVNSLAMIKRWKMQVDRDRSQQAVATVKKIHSLLIEVEVKQNGIWERMIMIADTVWQWTNNIQNGRCINSS